MEIKPREEGEASLQALLQQGQLVQGLPQK
jgi:hypothetical protein